MVREVASGRIVAVWRYGRGQHLRAAGVGPLHVEVAVVGAYLAGLERDVRRTELVAPLAVHLEQHLVALGSCRLGRLGRKLREAYVAVGAVAANAQVAAHGQFRGGDVAVERRAVGGRRRRAQLPRHVALLAVRQFRVFRLNVRVVGQFLAGGVVVVQRALGTLVAGLHNVLDERAEIDLEVRVLRVERVGVRLQVAAVQLLPGVGHAVLVSVEVGSALARAEGLFRVAVDVAHQVYAACLARHGAFVGGRAVARLGGVALIHVVALQRAAGIVQHAVEGHGSRVGGHFAVGGGLVHLHLHAVRAVNVDVRHPRAVVVVGVGRVAVAVLRLRAAVVVHLAPVGIGRGVQLVAADVVAAEHGPILALVARAGAVGY